MTKNDFEQARPAAEARAIRRRVCHGGAAATTKRPNTQGKRTVNQTIRLDQDVLDAYRQEGRGWQTHITDVLRRNMPKHK